MGTAPFTVETLSLQPKVLRVRNFISRAEAAALRRMGEDAELEERLMQGPPGCEDSPAGCDVFRNETASWLAPSFGHWSVLPPYGPEPLLAGVRRRLSTLLRIDPALMEATTISRMQAGNHHWSHHDFHTAMVTQDPLDLGYFDDVRRESPCAFAQHLRLIAIVAQETINRFVSANIFLNDPSSNDFSSGGELNFPVRVHQTQRKLLSFSSNPAADKPDLKTALLSAGCRQLRCGRAEGLRWGGGRGMWRRPLSRVLCGCSRGGRQRPSWRLGGLRQGAARAA